MSVGEWDQRQLCPDGGCTGLIGDDGLCKVCGRAAPNWGDERNRGKVALDAEGEPEDDDDDDDEDGDDEGDDELDDEDDGDEANASDDPEWGSRKLCPDGACVGVIGANGKCKVCGRSAA